MTNALLKKLGHFGELDRSEVELLDSLTNDVRCVAPKKDIVSEGMRPTHLHVILHGWAARYRMLPNGTRQITAFLIPGDFCDLHASILKLDHNVAALSACKVACIASDEFDRLTATHPRLTRSMLRCTLQNEAILREWIVNIGRRTSYERIAHLLCELRCRLSAVGLVLYDRFDFPVTQTDLADAAGLTAVHVNRVIRRLRTNDLIRLAGNVVTLKDVAALEKVAGFDPRYLFDSFCP